MSNLNISRAERLDMYVLRQRPQLSRSYASRLIEEGKVYVNEAPVTKAGYKIRTDDIIKIDYPLEQIEETPDIELPVIYEDGNVVVINKPTGVLSHSKGFFNPEATVSSWLRSRLVGMSGNRAGIVHRLDRATSGVMICAKNNQSLLWLQKQFSARKVKKQYVAIVIGQMKHEQAVIDMPIERNPKKPQTFRVANNGKPALTKYEVLSESKEYSMLLLKPTTGRTHQLRVHLKHLGHPIVGDAFYGGKISDRLYLHAKSLELSLPNGNRHVFEALVPQEFDDLMSNDK